MKKYLLIIFLGGVILLNTSCSTSVSGVLTRVQGSRTAEDTWRYYTSGTVKVVKKIQDLADEFELQQTIVRNEVPGSAKWEIVSEEINGTAAVVKVRFLEHPDEAYNGKERSFNMRLEGNTWKIDNEKKLSILYTRMKQTADILKQMSPIVDEGARQILRKTINQYNS